MTWPHRSGSVQDISIIPETVRYLRSVLISSIHASTDCAFWFSRATARNLTVEFKIRSEVELISLIPNVQTKKEVRSRVEDIFSKALSFVIRLGFVIALSFVIRLDLR